MAVSIEIIDFSLCKAFYNPGEPACFSLSLTSRVEAPLPVRFVAEITHLEQVAGRIEQAAILNGGPQSFTLAWIPLPIAPAGYGMDLSIQAVDGQPLASASTAFDVLDRWTQMPRYGFMTDFSAGQQDGSAALDALNRYHINGLQFSGWTFRPEQPLAPQDPYRDPAERLLSRKTIDSLVADAHNLGMAVMASATFCAATVEFYLEHPDWVLFGVDGKALTSGNSLVFMDPRPGSPWAQYIFGQFSRMLERTGFDGIHLEQTWDLKKAYDEHGRAFPLDNFLAQFVDATARLVVSRRKEGAVVFDAAGSWSLQAVAAAHEDFVYIEVRPPYTWFESLNQLIVQGQTFGHGKPVVLAAYLDPQLERNARLMDAIIFASGGSHNELGNRDGMLADPSSSKSGRMSSGLAEVLRRYYDFAVRYENVIGPATTDATHAYHDRVEIPGVSTSSSIPNNKVFPVVRETPGYTAISLVNLLGVNRPEWGALVADDPTPLGPYNLHLFGTVRPVKAAWLASPDSADLSLKPLAVAQDGGQLTLELPGLAYWSLLLIQW